MRTRAAVACYLFFSGEEVAYGAAAMLAVCRSSVLTALGALAPPTLAVLGPPMAVLRGAVREVSPMEEVGGAL